ncbi:DUF461 domain-containing protein [Streptomyces sp. CAU 1734]|uniref:DUF461 domain-containing protein n=1 Tax=Streptomyces sp. CAU 1734 TaxID=3140360 RepID=UPI0032613505
MSLPQTPSGANLRRGALAAAATALSIAVLTACGAGNNAQSLGIKPDTANVKVDSINIQNSNVITGAEGEADGPAVISATIFNSGTAEQTIDSVTLGGGAGTVKLSPAEGSGPVTVPAQGSIVIGGKGNASAVVENAQELAGNIGGVQEVVFRFSETGDVKIKSFVVAATADGFGDFGPSSLPAPAKPSPSAEPEGTPSDAASGEPGGENESGEPGAPAEGSADPAEGPADGSTESTG